MGFNESAGIGRVILLGVLIVSVSLPYSLFLSWVLQRGGSVENNAGSVSSGRGTSTYQPESQPTVRSQ